jgi:putative membrane protein
MGTRRGYCPPGAEDDDGGTVMWSCDGWLARIYPGAGNFLSGFGHFGGIIGVLIIIVLMVLIYKHFKSLQPNANAASDKHDSLVILKSRFARGEISLEEYHRMKEILVHQ